MSTHHSNRSRSSQMVHSPSSSAARTTHSIATLIITSCSQTLSGWGEAGRASLRCPKTASQSVARTLQCAHATRFDRLLSGAASPRYPFRRTLLRGRVLHAHLLPSSVHGETTAAKKLHLLSKCCRGRSRRLSAVFALSPGARSRQRQRRCHSQARAERRRAEIG